MFNILKERTQYVIDNCHILSVKQLPYVNEIVNVTCSDVNTTSPSHTILPVFDFASFEVISVFVLSQQCQAYTEVGR